MSKRARTSGGSFTGGTGDIKPQQWTIHTGEPAAGDDYAVNQVPLPVPRFGTMKTKATVFEILKVLWYPAVDSGDTVVTDFCYLTTSTARTQDEASSTGTMIADLLDPRTFAFCIWNSNITTSGGRGKPMPFTVDLTDNNGNGYLIATDQIFAVSGNVGGASPADSFAKIIYRLVNVGITEYVGIVQSQQ